MLLTVDIGNSNICIALMPDGDDTPLFFERLHTDPEKTVSEYERALRMILKMHSFRPSDISGCVLSSVVPKAAKKLNGSLRRVFRCPVLCISHELDLPFENGMDIPSTVGQDILCDAAGASTFFRAPFVTFDMGTATVCSAVLPQQKGPENGSSLPVLKSIYICPGVRTSLNSLWGRTSSLPDITLEGPKSVIGSNTADAMKSGIIFGTAGMADAMIDRIEEASGMKVSVTATGGLSPYIIPYMRHEVTYDPYLLMKGMKRIYEMNMPE